MATVIKPGAFRANAQRTELLRLRSKFLKNDRILGPAWIILIRLISRADAVNSFEVCDLISIPNIAATTAQRCMEHLLAEGLIYLGAGPGKRFRSVDLTPRTLEELRILLADIDDPHEIERRFVAPVS